jgi:hypothetical protein
VRIDPAYVFHDCIVRMYGMVSVDCMVNIYTRNGIICFFVWIALGSWSL